MKVFCPGCGAPIEFRYDDSFVRVCAACRSAIVRTDRGIDSFGQVADLTPTRSGLSLGARGRFRGTGFELVGRSEYRHPAGGSWEEWYLRLDDGRWAWLGEAQGAWVVTFPRPSSGELPRFEELQPGARLSLGDPPSVLEVGECNTGTLVGAEGELPFQFTPGSTSRFADLGDGKGRFATLDYGAPGSLEAPSVYLGRRSTLAELELKPSSDATGGERQIGGERLACPSCGGGIELVAPERSLSVACGYCGSILSCDGPLAILSHQERPDAGRQPFPLGAVAEFEGVRYIVTGRLRRRAEYSGAIAVEWDEWLLYERSAGYRWLVRAKGHYSFVTPLSPGAVTDREHCAYYRNQSFALYDAAHPRVIGVWGEFYWQVSAGETVAARDFIAPPAMLSCEASENELHWSLGVYQTHAQIQRAFGLGSLPDTPEGVSGNQPFAHPWIGKMTGLIAVAFILCTLLRLGVAGNHRSYSDSFRLGNATTGGVPPSEATLGGYPTYVFFTPEFELAPRENVSITLSLPLSNSWAYASVDLIHEESGELRTFGGEISYYYGTEGGESWSEGGQSMTQVLPAGRSGRHLLRVELQTPALVQLPLQIRIDQDVFPWSHFGWALLVLGVPGLCLALYQWGFERARWSESDFAPTLYAGQSDE